VKAAYNALLEVLRTSTRARNFHRLDAIADKSTNDMAKVQAIKTMEAITEAAPPASVGPATRPGLVFVINYADGRKEVVSKPPDHLASSGHPMLDITPPAQGNKLPVEE